MELLSEENMADENNSTNRSREVQINPEDYEVPQEPNPLQIAPSINRVRRMARPVLSINRSISRRRATQVRHPSRSRVYSQRGYLLGRTFNKSNFFFGISMISNLVISIMFINQILRYSPSKKSGDQQHEVSSNIAGFLKKVILVRGCEIIGTIVDIFHFKQKRIFIRNYNYWFLLNKVVIYICFYVSLSCNWKHIYIGAAFADLIGYVTFFFIFRKNFMRYRNSPCFLPMLLWPAVNGTTQILLCFKIAELILNWNYILIPCYVLASLAFSLGVAFFVFLNRFFYDKYGKIISLTLA